MEGFDIVLKSLEVVGVVLENVTPNKKNILEKLNPEIFMADYANELVKNEGMTFRDAYKQASDTFSEYTPDIDKNLESKVSFGSPGNIGWKYYEERLEKLV